MKDKIKKKWIAALRSGKYKQGEGYLRQDDEYCCLGVLCDLYKKSTRKGSWENDFSDIYLFEGMAGILPLSVMEWANLDENGTLPDGTMLTSLNDDGYSFDYLADVIESSL